MKCSHSYSEALAYARRIRREQATDGQPQWRDRGGLKFLGAGADKSVYMLPCKQHVLKVGGGFKDWTSREIAAWRTLKQRQHYLLEYMAPVQRWSLRYNFMVQTYCKEYNYSLDFDQAHSDIEAMAADYGITDIYGENLGVLDSKLVIIDWGMLDQRKLQRRLIRDQSSDDSGSTEPLLRSKPSLRRDAKR